VRYKRGACATYRQVIDRVSGGGARKVYAYGGIVRDLVSGDDVSAADVDIKFGEIGKDELKSIFDDMRLAMRVDAQAAYTYFFVGCDIDNQLEGQMITDAPVFETPGNSLMIDLADMTLVDPTGHGIADAKARVWRVPPNADRDAWFDRPGGPRLLWRMTKFRLRGYSVPEQDVRFVYEKFGKAAGSKKVAASDFRNLINQVPDPADALALMVEDAGAGRAAAADVRVAIAGLLNSETVWKRVPAQGNVPFQTVCAGIREAEIARRRDADGPRRKDADGPRRKDADGPRKKDAEKRGRRRR
jgi:hypothetical protein